MITNEEQIIICAVRYALGRRTYIVGIVVEYVLNKMNILSKACKKLIIRDINDELAICNRAGFNLGDECDEKQWLYLMDELKNNIHEKTSETREIKNV